MEKAHGLEEVTAVSTASHKCAECGRVIIPLFGVRGRRLGTPDLWFCSDSCYDAYFNSDEPA